MKNVLSVIIKVLILVFGILLIAAAFTAENFVFPLRIVCTCSGILVCVAAFVPIVRNLLIAVLAFITAFSGIGDVYTKENGLDIAYLLTCLLFLIIALIFIYKTYRTLHPHPVATPTLAQIDAMSGTDFEVYTAKLMKQLGYTNVKTTKHSGDQGVDVLAEKDDIKYAIQCKKYSEKLGNTPIQEVYAGKRFYDCSAAAVITNSYFTSGAHELANKTGVLLWDRTVLQKMISSAQKRVYTRSLRGLLKKIASFRRKQPDVPPAAEEGTTETPTSISNPPEKTTQTAEPQPYQPIRTDFCFSRHKKPRDVDTQFIAEAQWYAAREKDNWTDDQQTSSQ